MVVAQKFIPVEVSNASFHLRSCIEHLSAVGAILQYRCVRPGCKFKLNTHQIVMTDSHLLQTYMNAKVKLLRMAAAKKAERDLKDEAEKKSQTP